MRLAPLLFVLVSACRSDAPVVRSETPPPVQAARPLRARLVRTLPGDRGGSVLRRLGDWDGDGTVDLVITGYSKSAPGVRVLSSNDGHKLAEFAPLEPSAQMPNYSYSCAAVGDIDADGRDDVVDMSLELAPHDEWVVTLRAFGSARTLPIWRQSLHLPPFAAPVCLAAIGDVDQDGLLDLGVGLVPQVVEGRRSSAASDSRGIVEARSGRDGRLLWTASGAAGLKLGVEMAPYADADGDGVQDVAVLEVFRNIGESMLSRDDPKPRIDIRSGANGEHLRFIDWERDTQQWGSPTPYSLRGGSDIDADGFDDLVLRSYAGPNNSARVISGRTHATLAVLTPHPDPNGRAETWFPSDIAIAPDLDGDGLLDLLLGHAEVGTDTGIDYGAIYVHSTRTNERLVAVWGTADDVALGGAIAWLGDTDHDGAPEFAAITTFGIRVWAVEADR